MPSALARKPEESRSHAALEPKEASALSAEAEAGVGAPAGTPLFLRNAVCLVEVETTTEPEPDAEEDAEEVAEEPSEAPPEEVPEEIPEEVPEEVPEELPAQEEPAESASEREGDTIREDGEVQREEAPETLPGTAPEEVQEALPEEVLEEVPVEEPETGAADPAAGEAPTEGAAAEAEAPTEPGAEAAASMADFQQQVRRRAAAVPRPQIASGAAGGAAIQSEAERRAGLLHIIQSEVPQQAAGVAPAPEGLPPVAEPTPENPVPQADRMVDEVSGRQLPAQIPPVLEASPRGNHPQIGRAPLPPEMVRRLHHILDEGPPVSDPSDMERMRLIELRETLLNPAPAPTQAGPPAPLPQPAPPQVRPLRPELRTDATQVFARLLAQPDQEAKQMLDQVRTGLFPRGIVQQLFPTLGDEELLPGLTSSLTAQLRTIAEQAGVAAADLDREVIARQEELRSQELLALADAGQCSVDASQLVSQAGQDVNDAVATGRAGIDARVDSTRAAAEGGGADALVNARRDRLVANITRKVGEQDALYRQAGESREGDLSRIEREQVAAYQAAAQQDEFQLVEHPPEGTDEVGVRGLVAASNAWRDRRVRFVHGEFTRLRREASDGVATLRSDVESAGDRAREEIRTWAAGQTGETRTWWDRLFETIEDWAAQAAADATAWQGLQDTQTAATVTESLDMIDRLQRAAEAGISEEELLQNNQLTAEQRAIVSAFFHREPGAAFDPIGLVAAGVRGRLLEERRSTLVSTIETRVFEQAEWDQLQTIGNAGGSPVDIADRSNRIYQALHGGLFGVNEVEPAMAQLGGLNRAHREALKKHYHLRHPSLDLEADLQSELSDAEGRRAQALLRGDRATAIAEEVYSAMHETFLYTGIGTDEQTIMRALRGLTEEERDAVLDVYQRQYGRNLRTELGEELSDWGMAATTHDVERAEALLDLNVARADAIAIDQSLYTGSGLSTRQDVTAVYDQVRTDVEEQARREGWTSAQREAEITRRVRAIEGEYDERYANTTVLLPGPDGSLQPVRHGTLRESFGQRTWGADRDMLEAYADNSRERIDAARIRIEQTSLVYASDTEINNTLHAQYTRALEDVRADVGPERRRLRERELAEQERAAADAGHPWTADERFYHQQLMEQALERELAAEARLRAQGSMERLTSTYSSEYGESLHTVVAVNTQGVEGQQALTLLAQGGYLSPYQAIEYGVTGAGTNEEQLREALRGLTHEELADLRERWRREHGEELDDRILSELSGTDAMEAQVSLMGQPETLDERIAVERRRVDLERPTNWFAAQLAGPELLDMEDRLSELEQLREDLRNPSLSPERQQELLGDFEFRVQTVSSATEVHRQAVSSVTESIANAASIAVALAVGIGGAIFTGGASAALALAVIASIAATATSIGTRALLLGNAYGTEELWTDIGLGAVDAVVAALTAGIGNRLMGLRQVAASSIRQQGVGRLRQLLVRQLARFGNVGSLTRGVRPLAFLERMASQEASWFSRFGAEAISQSIENTIQSLPTALVGSALDESNWQHGNPLLNIVGSSGQQLAHGLVMGMALHVGMQSGGSLWRGAGTLLHGPRLGVETHGVAPREMTPRERAAHLREYLEMYPGRTEADFDATIAREQARATAEVQEEAGYRDRVREQLLEGLPADVRGNVGDVPITVLGPVEFALAGGTGDGNVRVVVRDGQVHLVVRQGADPAVVREHAARVNDLVEPGTGGRAKGAGPAPPRPAVDAGVPLDTADALEARALPGEEPHETAARLRQEIAAESQARAAERQGRQLTEAGPELQGALPKDLRQRVPVLIDPDLPGRTVEVRYEVDERGVVSNIHIVAGPDVRPGDIALHADTARAMRRYAGLSGRVRALLDRLSWWGLLNGDPPVGSRAWEARLELEKLPGVLADRVRALAHGDLDDGARARLEAEIDDLQHQIAEHQRTVRDIDLDPGEGFVAAKEKNLPEGHPSEKGQSWYWRSSGDTWFPQARPGKKPPEGMIWRLVEIEGRHEVHLVSEAKDLPSNYPSDEGQLWYWRMTNDEWTPVSRTGTQLPEGMEWRVVEVDGRVEVQQGVAERRTPGQRQASAAERDVSDPSRRSYAPLEAALNGVPDPDNPGQFLAFSPGEAGKLRDWMPVLRRMGLTEQQIRVLFDDLRPGFADGTYRRFVRRVRGQILEFARVQADPISVLREFVREHETGGVSQKRLVPDSQTAGTLFRAYRERLTGLGVDAEGTPNPSTVRGLKALEGSATFPDGKQADGIMRVSESQAEGGPQIPGDPEDFLVEDKAGDNPYNLPQARRYSDKIQSGHLTTPTGTYAGIIYVFEDFDAATRARDSVVANGLSERIFIAYFNPAGEFRWLPRPAAEE